MASVRITHNIRYYVKQQFETMFTKRMAAKLEELQHLRLGEQCYEHHVSAKSRQLAAELNHHERWIDDADTINIEVTYTCAVTNLSKATIISVRFRPPVPLPARFRGSYSRSQMKLVAACAGYEHAVKILREHDAIQAERDNLIKTMVDGVLTECSTLRQVLEVWPSALDFMPGDVRTEHNKKTEKRINPAKDISIDDGTKAMLLKARMLTTGS